MTIIAELLSGGSSGDQGIVATYLLQILDVLMMGFRFYALLAAVYINSIFTLACATIYAWLDYSMTIVIQGMCQPRYYPTFQEGPGNIANLFNYYGTGPNLIVMQLCVDIPRFLCLAYISVKLPLMLIIRIYNKFKRDLPLDEKILSKLTREQRLLLRTSQPDSVEMLYVKNLFQATNHDSPSQSLFARLIPKKIYKWRDDYRFSTRIVSIYSSIVLLVYFVTIETCVQLIPLLASVQKTLQESIDGAIPRFMSTADNTNNGEINSNTSNFPLPDLTRAYICALLSTFILIVVQLLVLLVNIRRNLLQSFRGNASEIPRREKSKYISYAEGNFHFAGYLIGYLIWGIIITATLFIVLFVCIDAFITYGSVRLIEVILEPIIPSTLLAIFKIYLNKILAQYVFLQHRGEVLSFNNRRILMIFLYFNFFLDAFLGFFSAIIRLIKSVLAGVVYMCRLDYCPLGRQLEAKDSGFRSYYGFIHTECAHRHPVMLVFVSHLYTQIKIKDLIMDMTNSSDSSVAEKYKIKTTPSSRYIRKWKLAIFLTRHPMFIFYRKAYLNLLHVEERQSLNEMNVNDPNQILRRLPILLQRTSPTQPSIVTDIVLEYFEVYHF